MKYHIKFRKLHLAGLCLLCLSCKPSPSSDISHFIAQNCAQHPINFYFHEQEKGTQIYTYGSRDVEFRDFLANLQVAYHKYGQDITGAEKVSVVGQFLPNYIQTCKQFFQPVIEECDQHPPSSPAFQQCLSRYNRAYEEALSNVMKKSGPDRVNLDAISLTHYQRPAETDFLH